jgi:hypothetical protein
MSIAREFQDVPLRNAHMLEHLPCTVWQSLNALATMLGGKVFHEIIETDVRIATA